MKKVSLLSIFLLLVILSAEVFAQVASLNPVDPKRESAQATLKTFFDAFRQPRMGVTPDPLDEAIKCVDLRGVPPEFRAIKGLDAAAQIKEALDVVENFHIDDAPADPNAEPFYAYRSAHGEIILARQNDGEWLFTQETVRSIPVLIAEIEKERILTGTVTLTQSESVGSAIRERMPPVLKQKFFILERWQWLGLAALIFLGLIAGWIIGFLSKLAFHKILKRRFPSLTEPHLGSIYSVIRVVAFVVTLRLGLRGLALTQNALTAFRTVIFVATAMAVIWFLYRAVAIVAHQLRQRSQSSESQLDDLLVPFVSGIIRIVIFIIGVIVVAENLKFDITGLIAGLGIGGIAIALASQETLSNFFGSLVLLLEQPFRAKDRVEIEDVKGIVKEVGLRSTKILTYDDALITLPNSTIAKASILNLGVKRQRRWVLKLNVPFQEFARVEKFCDGIREIIVEDENLDEMPFQLHFFDMTDQAVTIRIAVYFKDDSWAFELDARDKFIRQLLKLAEKLKVELAIEGA